jgi:hypothetical protein
LWANADGARWPTTLFLPGAESTADDRRFALPGGGEGETRTAFSRGGEAGTMAHAERRIETAMGATRRVTIERWTLAPAD